MIQGIIVGYTNGIAQIKRQQDNPLLWEKMSLYLNFQGLQSTPDTLKKIFNKAVLSLCSDVKRPLETVNLEDVFFKVFKKFEFKAKKKHIKEIGVLFQVLTVDSVEADKDMRAVIEYAKAKEIILYALADGHGYAVNKELRAMGLMDTFKSVVCTADEGQLRATDTVIADIVQGEAIKKKAWLYVGLDDEATFDAAIQAGIKVICVGDTTHTGVQCKGTVSEVLACLDQLG